MSDHARIVECLIHATADLRLLRGAMPDRRERIATAALAGMLAHCGESSQHCGAAAAAAFAAVAYADALIAELDKEVQP